MQEIWEFIVHLDQNLVLLYHDHGLWFYAVLFFVIFAETGFVITTILPSDSVIFAVGALTTKLGLSLLFLYPFFALAAFLGDTLNFWIGRVLGEHFFRVRKIPFLSRESLDKAALFYKEHGGLAIIASRFVPVLRSFAPLVGGIARMDWRSFLFYNALGKVLWTAIYLFGGYFLGKTWIGERFELIILAALGAPLCVALFRFLWVHYSGRRAKNGV